MGLAADLRTLLGLARGMPRQGPHAQRLERFYAGQAADYDRFRARLLHGRDATIAHLCPEPGMSVAELGCGTGRNLQPLVEGPRAPRRVWAVDLCPSLLGVARQRINEAGWHQVQVVQADAAAWQAPAPLDGVLCSYSLTMMPDWSAVLDHAIGQLRRGGRLAVVDFTVIDAQVAAMARVPAQPAPLRWLWRRWFAHDGVHPDPGMLPALAGRLRPRWLTVERARLPWLPLRAAWFGFVGEKP